MESDFNNRVNTAVHWIAYAFFAREEVGFVATVMDKKSIHGNQRLQEQGHQNLVGQLEEGMQQKIRAFLETKDVKLRRLYDLDWLLAQEFSLVNLPRIREKPASMPGLGPAFSRRKEQARTALVSHIYAKALQINQDITENLMAAGNEGLDGLDWLLFVQPDKQGFKQREKERKNRETVGSDVLVPDIPDEMEDILLYALRHRLDRATASTLEETCKAYVPDLLSRFDAEERWITSPPVAALTADGQRAVLMIRLLFRGLWENPGKTYQDAIRDVLYKLVVNQLPPPIQLLITETRLFQSRILSAYAEWLADGQGWCLADFDIHDHDHFLAVDHLLEKVGVSENLWPQHDSVRLFAACMAARWLKWLEPIQLSSHRVGIVLTLEIYGFGRGYAINYHNGLELTIDHKVSGPARQAAYPSPQILDKHRMIRLYSKAPLVPQLSLVRSRHNPIEPLLQRMAPITISDTQLNELYARAAVILVRLASRTQNAEKIVEQASQVLQDPARTDALGRLMDMLLYLHGLTMAQTQANRRTALELVWPGLAKPEESNALHALSLKRDNLIQRNQVLESSHVSLLNQSEQDRKSKDLAEQRNGHLETRIARLEADLAEQKRLLAVAVNELDESDRITQQPSTMEEDTFQDMTDLEPYHGQGILFGGHEAWHNKLKAYLPNFDFVPANTISFDVNRMRRFNTVYMFTNYCSHKMTYRLKANLLPQQNIVYLPVVHLRLVLEKIRAQEASAEPSANQ